MKMLMFLLFTSVAIIGLAYVYYEPIPEGLSLATKSRISFAGMKTGYLISCGMSYLGYSKGSTFRALSDFGVAHRPNKPVDPSISKKDLNFNGVHVRVYTPLGTDPKPRRGVVFYHGGGWIIGNIDLYEGVTLKMSKDLNAVVISVNYRMAPQYIFPAAIDDCEKATTYFLQHATEFGVDPTRIAVSGDSAGGNLAAAVSIRLRNQKVPQPKLQVLFFPVTQVLDFDTPSYRANKYGPLLTKNMMTFFAATYMLGEDGTKMADYFQRNEHTLSVTKQSNVKTLMNIEALPKDAFLRNYKAHTKHGNILIWEKIKDIAMNSSLSPLFEKDLAGLPPAYVTTCQHDVLRDDGFFYVKRLKEAGVQVQHDNMEACYHGWILEVRDNPVFSDEMNKIITYMNSNL